MATLWRQPSLEFDVKVVRVAGIEARLEGSLFVRYYVPAGDGRRRIRVDTREVPCGAAAGGGDVFWGDLVRFQLAMGAKSASAESWLRLSPVSRELDSRCKAPKLLVEVKVVNAVAADGHVAIKSRKSGGGANVCCRGGESCPSCGWVGTEEDMFLAATFTQ